MDSGVGSGDIELNDNGKGTVGLLPDSEILKQWVRSGATCLFAHSAPVHMHLLFRLLPCLLLSSTLGPVSSDCLLVVHCEQYKIPSYIASLTIKT